MPHLFVNRYLAPVAVTLVIVAGINVLATTQAAFAQQWVPTAPVATTTRDDGTAEDSGYTLTQLLSIAQRTNPSAKEAMESARQADLAAQLVRGNYAPQVSLKALGGIQRTPIAIPDNVSPKGYFISDSREIIPSLELKWLLFDFGRRQGRESEADDTALAANAGLLGTREKLAFEVTQHYCELSAAIGRLSAAQKMLETALISEQAALAAHQHGRATIVAVTQAQQQSAGARLALAKMAGAVQTAQADLASTVGLPIGTPLKLAKQDNRDAISLPNVPIQTLVQEAIEIRPDVVAAQAQISAAQAKVETERAAYRPTISLSAQLFQNAGQVSSDGSPYSSVNRPGGAVFIAVELPLLDGGVRATNVSLAISEQSAAEDKLDETRDAASTQVVRAYSELKTGLAERAQANAYVAASTTAYESALASFKRGLATYTDLAGSEAALAQALSSQQDANADVQIASSALALATGTLQPALP